MNRNEDRPHIEHIDLMLIPERFIWAGGELEEFNAYLETFNVTASAGTEALPLDWFPALIAVLIPFHASPSRINQARPCAHWP